MENTDADVCCGKCCEAEENNDVNNDDDDDDNNDVVYDDIDSSTPSHFNSSDHLFHINFLRSIQHIPTDIKRLVFFLSASLLVNSQSVHFNLFYKQ